MSSPLHHTLKDHAAVQWLLCRQWCERINLECELLKSRINQIGGDKEFQVWYARLEADVTTMEQRASEDGYVPVMAAVTNGMRPPLQIPIDRVIPDIFETGGLRFIPSVWEVMKDGRVTHATLWERKAVQP